MSNSNTKTFQVIFTKQAEKQLRHLASQDQKKIIKTLATLRQDPLPKGKDIKKMSGTKNSWRIRIGNVRIIYEIHSPEKKVWVVTVGYRGQIY